MKEEMIFMDSNGKVVEDAKNANFFECNTYDENDVLISSTHGSISKKQQKQNMTLEGFTTTTDLDRQLESILRSIEPEVMKSLKTSNYFNKQE